MYPRFSLSLMVTHACNLRCDYCYTGRKSDTAMDAATGRAAISRAVRSIEKGGSLELGFFGGEPLLAADLIVDLIEFAKQQCRAAELQLLIHLTTNGTLASGTAWKILASPEIAVHLSHDGLPEMHDRHRRTVDGRDSSKAVLETLDRLQSQGLSRGVVMVVRPDTVESLTPGIRFLRSRGVRHVVPTLDIWTKWTSADAARLEAELVRCADVWREGLPECSISWFDEKAARLVGLPPPESARCGFGDGEVAVAPSGNLYPCERLIGEDGPDNPMRLPGAMHEGDDFQPLPVPGRTSETCSSCGIQTQCNTTCRCTNYVRTGDVRRPDGLLCLLDRTLVRETARALDRLPMLEIQNNSGKN
jgi:uncharacterized protein